MLNQHTYFLINTFCIYECIWSVWGLIRSFHSSGVHPDVDAAVDSKMEPAKRRGQRSFPSLGSEFVWFSVSIHVMKNRHLTMFSLHLCFSVSVISGHCPAEWLPALLWTCVPTLREPGAENTSSGHGENTR